MLPLPFISINDYDYALPHEQIALYPKRERDASKLLVYRNGAILDDHFYNLPPHIERDSTFIFNKSRVIAARLYFQKESGGTIEIFCLEPKDIPIEKAMAANKTTQWRCLIGGASKWAAGMVLQKKIIFNSSEVQLEATFCGKEDEHFLITFNWNGNLSFAAVLEKAGSVPLPPYIKRTPDFEDPERYQTVFAEVDGSVAAPTAALHFTTSIIKKLQEKNIKTEFVTLHVGAGTFKPVKSTTATAHLMHSEPFSITLETLEALTSAAGLIAVGTTSLRTLESLYWLGIKLSNGDADFNLTQWEAYTLNDKGYTYSQSLAHILAYLKNEDKAELNCRTSLMILPGYSFKSADGLVTNFHQPRSTLLLLIAAFIGEDWKRVYDHALKNDYRFLSYGDSSLLWRIN